MKISYMTIENFKSFSKEEIEKFKKINMIFGLNNSGKSNLLKLIEIIFRPKKNVEGLTTAEVDDKIESHTIILQEKYWDGIIENEPFIFRNNDTTKPIILTCGMLFEQMELEKIGEHYKDLIKEFPAKDGNIIIIEFTCRIIYLTFSDSKIILDSVKINDNIIFDSKGYFKNVKSTNPLFDNQEALENLMGLMNNSVLFIDNDRYFKREKEDRTIRSLSSKSVKNWLFNLSLNEFDRETFNNLLSSFKEFKITGDKECTENERSNPLKDLNILFARFNDEIEMIVQNEFIRQPMSNFGTGIQQTLYLLLRMFHSSAKIILIEEIELNLSPKYQIELMQFLNLQVTDKKRFDQIFFTTHSPLLCYRGDFNILKASINGKGETEIKDVSRDEVKKFSTIHDLVE